MIHQIGKSYASNQEFSGGVLTPGFNRDAIDDFGI